jgi:acyl-CoA thioesterase
MTPQALASACASQMWSQDHASAGLGMVLDAVTPGAARLSMRVERRMLNGTGTCHGGFIFALADSAFAFACNTGGDVSVASHCSIAYLRPAREGDVLSAAAEERQREGRQGIYDVRVTCGDTIIAEFRGLSRTTGAQFDLGPDAA